MIDGELTTGRFSTTMSALLGSKTHHPSLRFVAFDVPVLVGVDLRAMPWQERRERLGLLAQHASYPLSSRPWSILTLGWSRPCRTAGWKASSSRSTTCTSAHISLAAVAI